MALETIRTPSFEGGPRDSIQTPEKTLKVAYVVPIQDEVENGNIFFQLKDFARQEVDPAEFEVIYVVNNTAKDAQEKSVFFAQNERLFSILEFASGKTTEPPPDLQEWELNIVNAVRERKVKIQIMDLSTQGLSEKNIEEARTKGDNLAVKRFMQTQVKSSGAIVLMDADTRVASDYTTEIVRQLVDKPGVGMLKVQYDERPGEGGEKLYTTTAQARFSHTISRFMTTLHDCGPGGWYVIKAGELGIQETKYASAIGREMRSPKKGTTEYAENLTPFTQDRARPETVGGQFGGNRFASINRAGQGQRQKTIEDPVLGELSSLYERLEEEGKLTGEIERKILSTLKTLVSDPDIDAYIGRIQKEKYARGSEASRGLFERSKVPVPQYAERALAMITSLIAGDNNAVDTLNRTIAEQEKREKIRHAHTSKGVNLLLERAFAQSSPENISIDTLLAGKVETPFAHFLKANEWIVDVLKQVRTEAADLTEARELLNQRYPELLASFEQTEYTKAQAVLLGVNEFIKQIHSNARAFPIAARTLGIF